MPCPAAARTPIPRTAARRRCARRQRRPDRPPAGPHRGAGRRAARTRRREASSRAGPQPRRRRSGAAAAGRGRCGSRSRSPAAVAATAALMGGAAYLVGGDTAPPADDAFTVGLPRPEPRRPGAVRRERRRGRVEAQQRTRRRARRVAERRAARRTACPRLGLPGTAGAGLPPRVGPRRRRRRLRGPGASAHRRPALRHGPGTASAAHADVPARSRPARCRQPAAAPPVNVLTGHPATEDGFVAAPLDTAAAGGPAAPAGARSGSTGRLPSGPSTGRPAATFTYISELPGRAGRRRRGRPGARPSRQAARRGHGAEADPGPAGAGPGTDCGAARTMSGRPPRGARRLAAAGSGRNRRRSRTERVIFLECLESTDRSSYFC